MIIKPKSYWKRYDKYMFKTEYVFKIINRILKELDTKNITETDKYLLSFFISDLMEQYKKYIIETTLKKNNKKNVKLLKEILIIWFGKKCRRYYRHCSTCEAYKIYEDFKAKLKYKQLTDGD